MTGFDVCDDLARELDELTFDPAAGARPLFGAVVTIVWADEFPGTTPLRIGVCHPACRAAFLRLLEARVVGWRGVARPPGLAATWDEAHARVPGWPGLRRAVLSSGERKALAQLLGWQGELEETLYRHADDVGVAVEPDGPRRVTFSWDVDAADARGDGLRDGPSAARTADGERPSSSNEPGDVD